MSDLSLARAHSAAVLSAELRHQDDPLCCSKRHWRVRFPELKTWSASFRAAANPFGLRRLRDARDGPRRLHARHGWFRHARRPQNGRRRERGIANTYLCADHSFEGHDAEAFKVAMRDLVTADTSFAGRLAVDVDKPVSWEGAAPEHVVMIQFDNPDQAQAWKSSDAFKSFDAGLHRSSESTMQLVQPTPAARGIGGGRRGRGNVRFDQKAFEPNVKEYDQMLNKMNGICKGC